MLISIAEELGEFLHNISEENFRHTLSQPDTRWEFVQLTNITFYVYKLKDAPLGAPMSLPDFLRFNRGLANVSGNDNLCFFCCLAVHKGVDRRWCEREAKQFFTAYCKCFDTCDLTGVEVFDLPNLEGFFKLNIVVYELEDAVAALVQQSRELYSETMRLNLHENHLSLITDFEKCCRMFKCTRCDKLWTDRCNFTRHTKTCSATVRESYPGGIYKNTPSIFEKLEDIGICVSQNIRHYPFYACFDFECYFSTESLPSNGEMLLFEARHVPLSGGIASNIPGYEEAVCCISDGNESDLVKKMVDYLNKLSDAAFEILLSKYQHVFVALRTSQNCRSENLFKEFEAYLKELTILGFSSASYDLNLIKPLLIQELLGKINFVIKRANVYLCIKTEKLVFLTSKIFWHLDFRTRNSCQPTVVMAKSSFFLMNFLLVWINWIMAKFQITSISTAI